MNGAFLMPKRLLNTRTIPTADIGRARDSPNWFDGVGAIEPAAGKHAASTVRKLTEESEE